MRMMWTLWWLIHVTVHLFSVYIRIFLLYFLSYWRLDHCKLLYIHTVAATGTLLSYITARLMSKTCCPQGGATQLHTGGQLLSCEGLKLKLGFIILYDRKSCSRSVSHVSTHTHRCLLWYHTLYWNSQLALSSQTRVLPFTVQQTTIKNRKLLM